MFVLFEASQENNLRRKINEHRNRDVIKFSRRADRRTAAGIRYDEKMPGKNSAGKIRLQAA
jgi:hypothetical protein